ncbi:PfpI endopeptidase-like protein [Acephala macrosclerotiorum]|nr:PfpI endopeptidase-like protein [Acephala macrosclerotiorum]
MALPKHLHIGVFVPGTIQLLDLSAIDLLGMMSPDYLRACHLPEALCAAGIPSTIHYISVPETGPFVQLTANASLKVTKVIDDLEVQPGKLDIVLVPGPDPAATFEERVLKFVEGHAVWKGEDGKTTDVLSVCTGVFLLSQSGILKGKKASGPRAIVPKLRKQFPDVEFIDDKRWVHDGNVWTSGGITNGQEMVACYMKEKFPGPATEAAIAMADVGEKGIDYSKGKSAETLWWLWQILKALTTGSSKRKRS